MENVEIISDGLIVTIGGFVHAAHEGSPLCDAFVAPSAGRCFPLFDVADEGDLVRVEEWRDRTDFGWWPEKVRVCEACARIVTHERTFQ
jgi:hypothetical protein